MRGYPGILALTAEVRVEFTTGEDVPEALPPLRRSHHQAQHENEATEFPFSV